MSDCIFCKIVKKELPSEIILENNNVIVIKDRAPKAPIHNLIISKKHIPDIASLKEEDIVPAGALLYTAQKLLKETPEPHAFRLIINNGAHAGQSVFHLHMHFLSGKTMLDF